MVRGGVRGGGRREKKEMRKERKEGKEERKVAKGRGVEGWRKEKLQKERNNIPSQTIEMPLLC